MQLKNYILLIALSFSSLLGFSTPLDSVGVENQGGKKVIIHKVDAKDSYYSISRRYSVNPKTLADFNANKMLQPGMTIMVPTDQAFETGSKNTATAPASGIIEYKVEPREYLGIIAKKFDTSVEDIKELNGLTSNNLSIGQIIKVRPGGNSTAEIAKSEAPAEKETVKLTKPVESKISKDLFDVIEYKVGPREYLGVIADKFNTTVEDIKLLNNLRSNTLSIGQILKIRPGEKKADVAVKPAPVADKASDSAVAKNIQGEVVEYKVSAKENLNSISRKFNTSVEDIKALNNLKTNELTVGQIIKVRYASAQPGLTPNVLKPKLPNISDTLGKDTTIINASDRLKRPVGVYGLSEVVERGVGIWIDDENIDATKMLALHRTAPIGTIIKVTNPMTGRSTFAKVVGKFTENESTKDVIIVITKAAADVIGVLDKRFQTSIVYGAPAE